MSIYFMLLLIVMSICTVVVIALNPNSKACKIDTALMTNGFKFTFETNEKSTPSFQK